MSSASGMASRDPPTVSGRPCPGAAASARWRCSAPTGTVRSVRRSDGRRSSHRPRHSRPRSLGLERRVRNRVDRGVYWASSERAAAALASAVMLGTVEKKLERTPYAAVATAASCEATCGEAPFKEIRPVMLRLGGVDRVVDGALHHPHVNLAAAVLARRSGKPDQRSHCDQVPLGHDVEALRGRRGLALSSRRARRQPRARLATISSRLLCVDCDGRGCNAMQSAPAGCSQRGVTPR